jgi:hypothetical protein
MTMAAPMRASTICHDPPRRSLNASQSATKEAPMAMRMDAASSSGS